MQRTIAAVLVILAGVFLVVVTLANNLFKVGPDFESLIDDFRPALTQQSLDTARKDLAGMSAVPEEFSTKLAPQLAQQMGQTPEAFNQFVQQQFPDVAAGMQAMPQLIPTFNGLIDMLDKQRPLFASADAIPTKDLPATTVPWGMVLIGVLMMVVGVVMWLTRRLGAILAVVLGVLVIVASVIMTLPSKAADTDELNANLKPIYNQALVDQAKGGLVTLGKMGTAMTGSMLPALAQQLQMQPDQLQAFLGQNFPATAAALGSMDQSLARFQGLVTVFEDNLDNYDTLKPVDFTNVIWMMIGASIVVLVVGLFALLVPGRRQEERGLHRQHPATT